MEPKYLIDHLYLELISTCNLNCMHCMLPETYRRSRIILPSKKAIQALDTAWRHGATIVSLTGGEPTLYPHEDLISIIAEARLRGLETYLITNGTRITERLADDISKLGTIVRVSLYGVDRESYIKFTGVDAFDLVRSGLKLLKEKGVPLFIRVWYTAFHRRLGIQVDDMVDFASNYTENVKVSSLVLPGRWQREWDTSLYSLQFSQRDTGGSYPSWKYLKRFTEPGPNCSLIYYNMATVLPDGSVMACPYMDEMVTHLNNSKWPVTLNSKIYSHKNFPWVGGRCSLKELLLRED